MSTKQDATEVFDLIQLLEGMRRQQQQLLDCATAKLDAMRRADVQAMQTFNAKEATLIEKIRQAEAVRRQLTDRLGSRLGWPEGAGRAIQASRLASQLPEPQRAQLLDAANDLRNAVFAVQRVNRVAGAVSRELVTHLGNVFASVLPCGATPIGYAGDGAAVARSDVRVFDAVG